MGPSQSRPDYPRMTLPPALITLFERFQTYDGRKIARVADSPVVARAVSRGPLHFSHVCREVTCTNVHRALSLTRVNENI